MECSRTFVGPGKAKTGGLERIYESGVIVATNDMDSIREVILDLQPFFGQTRAQRVFTMFFIESMPMSGRQNQLLKNWPTERWV